MSGGEPQDLGVRDGSIRLGQLLKLANLVETGAEAKDLLGAEVVTVNGTVETRRGRQLGPGDVVELLVEHAPPPVRVVTEDPDGPGSPAWDW